MIHGLKRLKDVPRLPMKSKSPTPILRRCVFLPSHVEQFHSLVLDSEKPKMAENKIADDKFCGNCQAS